MYLVVTIKIVAWLLIVFVAACIYGQQKKDPINFAYFLFSAYAGTWVFLELLVDIPVFYGSEDIIYRSVTAVWIPAGFFFMNFAYALAERKVDFLYLSFLLSAFIGAVIGVTTDLVLQGTHLYDFGTMDVRDPFIHTAFTAITLVPATFGLWLIGKKLYLEKEPRLRRPLKLVFAGGAFSMSACFVLNVALPNFFGILDFPRLGSSSLAVLVVLVYFAMRRFNFLAITVESIAESLFHNVEHGLTLLSPEGIVQEMNPALSSILETNPGQAIGRDIDEIFPGFNCLAGEDDRKISIEENGVKRQYSLSRSTYKHAGLDVGTILQARDVTDDNKSREVLRVSKEQLEIELQKRSTEFLQIQKMEAIGTLAGGIAHDFNNLLTTILGFATATLDDIDREDPLYQDTKEIILAADKAKGIVAKISNFRPRSDEDRTMVEPSLALEDSLGLIGASLGNNIALRKKTPRIGGYIFVDETLLHQALLNLFTNAIHAMKSSGGLLIVEIEAVEVDEETARSNPPAGSGPHARIVVADTGGGIPEHIVSRIFEPFFTTKSVGEGTGLGLATVLRMAKDSNGFVTVRSEIGKGSSFSIYLPLTHASSKIPRESEPPVPGGTELIYIVDDNEQVARAGKRMLEPLGYTTKIFGSGKEALAAFTANMNEVDMVLTDESMPKMTGTELAIELLKFRPDLPILLISGGETGDKTRITAQEVGISKFLSKPLTKDTLAITVRKLLDK